MKKIALSLLTAVLVAGSYVGAVSSQSSSNMAPGLMPRGTISAPGMYFAGDRDNGIYTTGSNALAFAASSTQLARIQSTAGGPLVSVGATTAPSSSDIRLVVSGGSAPTLQLTSTGNGGGLIQTVAGGQLRFYTHTGALGSESYNERARIQADGTFSINATADTAFQLDVNGAIAHNGTAAYWLKGVTTFTSGSGTYNVPSGVRAIHVQMVGGGGGGGYVRSTTTAGARCSSSGGSGGAYVAAWLTGLSASYSYSVGAAGTGGVGGTSTAATGGANTTFSTFIAGGGGAGGDCTVTTNTFERTHPGSSPTNTNTGAYANGLGGAPGIGTDDATDITLSWGGASFFSGGANPGTAGNLACVGVGTSKAGTAGTQGSGGSGACAWRNAADLTPNGGDGGVGLIVITEYF